MNRQLKHFIKHYIKQPYKHPFNHWWETVLKPSRGKAIFINCERQFMQHYGPKEVSLSSDVPISNLTDIAINHLASVCAIPEEPVMSLEKLNEARALLESRTNKPVMSLKEFCAIIQPDIKSHLWQEKMLRSMEAQMINSSSIPFMRLKVMRMSKERFDRSKSNVNIGTIGRVDYSKQTLQAAIINKLVSHIGESMNSEGHIKEFKNEAEAIEAGFDTQLTHAEKIHLDQFPVDERHAQLKTYRTQQQSSILAKAYKSKKVIDPMCTKKYAVDERMNKKKQKMRKKSKQKNRR